MESRKRLCPICGKEAHVFQLSEGRVSALAKGLLGAFKEHPDADFEGYWCVGCLTPYLVVWLETPNGDEALRMAGFPPKGGVL